MNYRYTPRPLVHDCDQDTEFARRFAQWLADYGPPVPEHQRCWGTGTHGGPCPHRAETDVGLCLDCRDEIKARVD